MSIYGGEVLMLVQKKATFITALYIPSLGEMNYEVMNSSLNFILFYIIGEAAVGIVVANNLMQTCTVPPLPKLHAIIQGLIYPNDQTICNHSKQLSIQHLPQI